MHRYLIPDAAVAVELLSRLLPVLAFAAGMSVIVNLAARAGLFEWAASRVNRAGFLGLCVVIRAGAEVPRTVSPYLWCG